MKWITCLSLCLFLFATTAGYSQDSVLVFRKYPVVNIATRLWLREYGLYSTPFVKRLPWLTFGVGYRRKAFLADRMDCIYAENALVNAHLHGPVVLLGFDSHNLGKQRKKNHLMLVGFRRLDAGRLNFVERGVCGIIHDGEYTATFDASAKELFFKYATTFGSKSHPFELFWGLGGGFRWTRKAFVESGRFPYPWPDDDIETVLYFVPQLETGFRWNMFNIKRG